MQETSLEAYESVRPQASIIRDRVLGLFHAYGSMTDEEMSSRYQDYFGRSSYAGPRARRGELVRDGKLRDSGRRTVLASGRKAIIWEVV